MSIIRTEHNRENPYVMLNKSPLEDRDLSWEAKGIWSYLISRKDNWKVSVAHLSKIYPKKGGGRDAIYSILNELIEKGYCKKEGQAHTEKGKFTAYEYVIYEFKICSTVTASPEAAEPETDQPDTVEPATSNKSNTVKNDCIKKSSSTKEPANAVDAADFSSKEPDKPKAATQPRELQFTDAEREELNNYTPQQIEEATASTNDLCSSKANRSRVKYFFKVLTSQPKKSKNQSSINNAESVKEILKHWIIPKNIKIEFYYSYLEIQFSGHANAKTLSYSEKGFDAQLDNLLRKSGCQKKIKKDE